MMSAQGQISELYLTIGQLNVLLIFVAFISGGVCQTVLITCPNTFKDGEWGNVNCSVNSTKVASASSCYPQKLQFAFQSVSETTSNPLCETPYPGTCGQAGRMNCSCVGVEANIYTYQLSILGNRTAYGDGTLICSIDCQPLTSFAASCTATYETSSTTTTTESTSGSTPSINVTAVHKQGKRTCDDTCIGLAAGIPSAVVIVLIAIAFILTKIGVIRSPERCCKEAQNTSRQSQENNAETNTMSKQENRTSNQPATNAKESKVTAPNKNRPTK
ncbi:uncharacterized protein LOC112567729 isoform X2 [Pomacea canaliculata]|uniref:uncharacterized protein LOC112567729 isoform X2 n=1 Tax=Pomacea canaliculata TaxID=400727 RepID=UPI000D7399C3|nr:uncharacterized protein LOC112567729 isoform X2 [Pomacea canaliculata]